MASNASVKDKTMAAYLKKMGVVRNTAACPNHCGAQPRIGGPSLISHLNVCKGTKRVSGRR